MAQTPPAREAPDASGAPAQEGQSESALLSGALRKSGLPEGEEGVTIPLKPMFVGLSVEVEIDGKPVNLILDTGFSVSALSREAADRLGLNAEKWGIPAQDASGTRIVTERALTRRISLGGAWTTNEPVVVSNLPFGPDCDGVLGMSTVADWDVRIDPARMTLSLLPSGKAAAIRGETVLPLQCGLVNPEATAVNPQGLRELILEVPVGLGGHVVSAVPDTGYGGILQLSSACLGRISPATLEEASPSLVQSIVVSGARETRTGKLPEFSFGPDILRGLPVEIVDATPGSHLERAGLVGLNILRHYVMTFRFSAGELRLKPLGTVQEVTSRSTAGINLAPGDGGSILILSVVPGGPAEQAGLQAGDELLEIEGRLLKTMQPKEFAALKQVAPGTRVKVRYRRGEGGPVDATLVLVKE